MSNLEGQTFAGYEIIAKIGESGVGTVYKARKPMAKHFAALRVIAPRLGADAAFVARFNRVAAAIPNLVHPNLVQVHAAGESKGNRFIAMEFVEGESLRQRLDRRGRLDAREAIAVTILVAQALRYAWNNAEMAHGNIRPDNIFLSESGQVKVGDIGLAKCVGTQMTDATRKDMAMSSASYISPEQAQGTTDLGFRTDIYSLGCALWHMLTGKPPYEGDSAEAILKKHVHDPLPAIAKIWPACPAEVGRLLEKMLAKERRERHQNYDDLIAELTRVRKAFKKARVVSLPAPPPAPATETESRQPAAAVTAKWEFQRWKWALAGAAVGAVVVLAGLWLWAPWRKPQVERRGDIAQLEPRAAPRPAVSTATGGFKPRTESGQTRPAVPRQTTAAKAAAQTSAEPKPVEQTMPAPAREDAPKPTVDLLPYIDPQQDAVSGVWTMLEGALVVSNAPLQRIEIPYQPPQEYDFNVHFMISDTQASVAQMLVASARSFAWIMGDWENNALFGFDLVGGAQGNANPTTCRPPGGLTPQSEYVSQVKVRNNGLKAFLNGALITQWETDYRDMDIRPEWRLRNPALIGLGCRGGPVIFNRIEVVEVTGQGRFTRSAPADLGKSGAASLAEVASRFQTTARSQLAGGEIRLLIVTQTETSSHDWQATTDALRDELQKDSRIKVNTLEDPAPLDTFDLSRYQVVFLHFDNKGKPDPSSKVRNNLKDFVNRGGGLVVFHAASSAFPNWSGYRDLAGKVWDRTKNTVDPVGPMRVEFTNTNHPITRGMKPFQTTDELFACLAGGKRVEMLATARARCTKRDEPMAFVFDYGKGRVFHTPLGHSAAAIRVAGTAELIRRGCAWAAGRDPVPTGSTQRRSQ